MRVAFLNPQGNFDARDPHWTEHPDFGGQLVYVKEVGLAMARMGIEVDILTRRMNDPQWSEFRDPIAYYDGQGEGLRIVRLPCGGERFIAKEELWPHLPEWVDEILAFYDGQPPDFFTGHYADGGFAGSLIKQQTGLGFTFTGHSLGAQKLDKLGMNISNAETLERRFHFSKRIAAERLSMREAFRIITSTRQERIEQYGHVLYTDAVDTADNARFAAVPPGVNTRIFKPEPGPEDEAVAQHLGVSIVGAERPRIVVSSRLDAKKNILGVVRAFCGSAELRERARLALYVRGIDDPFGEVERLPGEEQVVLEPVLALINDSGARSLVDFVNVQSQEALAASYRLFAHSGSVFVLSSFYEPFGLAPIEAGACGLAVVATRNGGPSEIFADGSGVLIDPADPDDIAAGIGEALTAHGDYAERIQRRVASTYTWDKTAEAYLAIIEAGRAASQALIDPSVSLEDSVRLERYLAARN